MTGPRPRRRRPRSARRRPQRPEASASFRVRFDEATPSGADPDLGPAPLRRRPGLGPLRATWLRPGLVSRSGVSPGSSVASTLELLRPDRPRRRDRRDHRGRGRPQGPRPPPDRVPRRRRPSPSRPSTVDWALTTTTGVPTRIPPIFATVFGTTARSFAPIRVRTTPPPGSGVDRRSLAVRPHELDPMGHVNNAVYLDWAEEAIRAIEPVGRRRARYRSAALAARVPRRRRLPATRARTDRLARRRRMVGLGSPTPPPATRSSGRTWTRLNGVCSGAAGPGPTRTTPVHRRRTERPHRTAHRTATRPGRRSGRRMGRAGPHHP